MLGKTTSQNRFMKKIMGKKQKKGKVYRIFGGTFAERTF
jgi:hypothetical protein